MLNPEDIDDDYFTPLPNTSLKNIFGGAPQDKPTSSDPLIYLPSKAQTTNPMSVQDTATQNLFACGILAYEWCEQEHGYQPRGKLGLVIAKTNNSSSIVLYDTNKITLSSTTITPNLKVSTIRKQYLSFCDDKQTRWNIVADENCMSELVKHLKELNVCVVGSVSPETSQSQDTQQRPTVDLSQPKENKESDTSSSASKKNKVSVSSRMASIGQSVLPKPPLDQTKKRDSLHSDYDSSSSEHTGNVKHGHHSGTKHAQHTGSKTPKRRNAKKDVPEVIVATVGQPKNIPPLYNPMFRSTDIMPMGNFDRALSNNKEGEIHFFINEQRLHNSELRMNFNKTSDKVDQVLDLLKNSTAQGNVNNSDFQTDVMRKLLAEYESKIKMYEKKLGSQLADTNTENNLQEYERKIKAYEGEVLDLHIANIEISNDYERNINISKEQLKVQNIDHDVYLPEPSTSSKSDIKKDHEIYYLRKKIKEYEETVMGKNNIITMLNNQAKEKEKQYFEALLKKDNEVKQLKETIVNLNNEKLAKMQIVQNLNTAEFESKIKEVMNKIFHMINLNFENNTSYMGENVKATIKTIFKKNVNGYDNKVIQEK